MVYVEWLRVRGALKWTAYVLAGVFVLCAILRVAVIGLEHNAMGRIVQLQNDPSSRVNDVTLADGTHRITIDNTRDKVHVVIEDHGWQGKHIEILDRSGREHGHDTVHAGSIHVVQLPARGGTLTVIDTNSATKFANYAIVGLIVALIVATVLGAPFAKENDGHLEVTLTKPIDRVHLGLLTVGIDVLGLVGAVVLGMICAVAIQSLFELPFFSFDPTDGVILGMAILAPIAWYALLNAGTASIKRGYGAVLGFAWPVAGLILLLSLIKADGNIVLTVVASAFKVLCYAIPFKYMAITSAAADQPTTAYGLPLDMMKSFFNLGMLAVLGLVYTAAAIVQWRRIES